MRFEKYLKELVHNLGNFLRGYYLIYLRSNGVQIGRNSMISMRAKIDTRRGKVVIGKNCHITYGCVILSHDRAASFIDSNDDGYGLVKIDDNVFVGVNSVIMRNVHIGENSIIGAGSVVTKDIPSNSIAIGNPARVIKNLY